MNGTLNKADLLGLSTGGQTLGQTGVLGPLGGLQLLRSAGCCREGTHVPSAGPVHFPGKDTGCL